MTRTLLTAACGAAVALGLLTAVIGLIPTVPDPDAHPTDRRWIRLRSRLRTRIDPDPAHPGDPPTTTSGWATWRWPTATGLGLLAWGVTTWPVAGLALAAAVIGLPLLLRTGQAGTRGIERAEAVEEWTRRLADVLVTGTGLEQAVTATVPTSPAPIRRPVVDLASRLQARWSTETALHAFADDLDDATGDLVVAALVLGSRRRGPGLAAALVAVADALAEEVAMRRKVEAERAKPRTTARTLTVITVGSLGVCALNTSYLRPYDTALGQLVLAALVAAFIAALAWMNNLGRPRPAPRVLAGAGVRLASDDSGRVR